VLVPVDHIVLNARGQLREIGAEASDADDEIAVIFRMDFGVPQFIFKFPWQLPTDLFDCNKIMTVVKRWL
jgi:hypothetical protein